MKDKEMAEEYICKGKCQDDVKKSFVYCRTCTRLKDFLAGLKAGRPQWHDLRKDPNDLPNGHRVVLNQVGMSTEYDPNRGFLGFGGAGIIAWCEIPTFDKE